MIKVNYFKFKFWTCYAVFERENFHSKNFIHWKLDVEEQFQFMQMYSNEMQGCQSRWVIFRWIHRLPFLSFWCFPLFYFYYYIFQEDEKAINIDHSISRSSRSSQFRIIPIGPTDPWNEMNEIQLEMIDHALLFTSSETRTLEKCPLTS